MIVYYLVYKRERNSLVFWEGRFFDKLKSMLFAISVCFTLQIWPTFQQKRSYYIVYTFRYKSHKIRDTHTQVGSSWKKNQGNTLSSLINYVNNNKSRTVVSLCPITFNCLKRQLKIFLEWFFVFQDLID